MTSLAEPAMLDQAAQVTGWQARLDLDFRRDGARTVLAGRRHFGPLRVQKELHPEGPDVCHAIIVHPPGGIVGGDSLTIGIDVGDRAHAQLTTPGATKWYRSAGAEARVRTRLSVGPMGVLEWLPQDALLFDGARAAIDTRIELATGAHFIGWDIVGLGRTASGERFSTGRIRQTVELFVEGVLVWCERAVLDGGSPALHSGAILAGAPVFGTMIVAGAVIDDGLVGRCRVVACVDGESGITRLPHVLVARYRGDSAAGARTYFALLWQVLRPAVVGRAAVAPRIWNT